MDCYQIQTVSSFSFGQSSIEASSYVEKLIHFGYLGGGICDVHSLPSFPYFHQAINEKNLTPIYGSIILIENGEYQLKGELVVLTEEGYLNLVRLINLHKDSYTLEELSSHSAGLALILKTEDERMKESDFLNDSNQFFYSLSKIFTHFYFGIEIYSSLESQSINVTREFIEEHSYESLAFPKVLYLDKEDGYQAYKMLNAIFEKKVISEEELKESGPFFLLSTKAMATVYSSKEVGMTCELAKLIHFTFMKKRGEMILTQSPDSKKELREDVINGLSQKFNNQIPDAYLKRVDYELSVIDQMHFNDYFLIVQDYVRFANNNGIKVGPGRGSSAGALVSYALGITKVDPIKYGLFFERFLNPLRKTMPDIDIDFEDDRRQDIINYLRTKYGSERAMMIVTYSTLQLRASIRNVGTIFNYPDNRIDSLCKTINLKATSFNDEYNNNYRFKKMLSDPYYQNVVSKAKLIMNYPINTSIHASGVILSEKPLSESIPVIKGDNTDIAGFEFKTLEEMGFLKMDILSLNYLTFINEIEKNILAGGLEPPNVMKDLTNNKAYDVLNNLQLTDIFQLESEGIGNAVRQIKVSSVSDIAAVIALYRPGPMSNIPLYASRKNTASDYEPIIPELKELLKDTYGIIVYQEQILLIAQKLAGFEGGKADLFRRAISKKDLSKIQSLKEDFIKGCKQNKVSEENSIKVYNAIEKFADYGFNKSHAFAYAFITYALAYYKGNYPWAFYMASFEKTSLGDNKAYRLIKELYSFSYSLKGPSINKSEKSITFKDFNLILGFDSIRGFNEKTYLPLIEERNKRGEFTSLGNFFSRVDLSSVSDRDLISLIDSGALDEFNFSRKSIKDHIEDLKMVSHFSSGEGTDLDMPYMEKGDSSKTVEEFMSEYTSLGSVLSFHLKDLIKGEKKYSRLFILLDNPIFVNGKKKMMVTDGYIKESLFYQGNESLAKYDIISVNEDKTLRFYNQAEELHKEEIK